MTFVDEDGVFSNHVLHIDWVPRCQSGGTLEDYQRISKRIHPKAHRQFEFQIS